MDRTRVQQERILLVDDEPNILATTQVILQVEGYEVFTAGSGEEALQMMKTTSFDLLIVDLNMYGMNGLELLEATHTFFPQPLTIMLTGYASLESAIKALHLGAYDYLIKPCSIMDLKYSVKRALEHRRLSETEALLKVSGSINSSFDQEEILNTVACTAANMLGLDRGIIALFQDNKENNRPALLSTVPCEEATIGEKLLEKLFYQHSEVSEQLLNGAPFACGNTETENAVSLEWCRRIGATSFLVAPIKAKDHLFGILYVDSSSKRQDFSSAALRMIQGLADQAAIALENARLYSQVVSKNQELAELNDKLKRLDQLKSNFLNIATHELRTPISIVLGYNTMLQEELNDQLNPDQRDMLDEAISNCQRLINLVNSMLDISRIEAGKLDINIIANDIRRCIDSAVRLLRDRAAKKAIQLEVSLAACLPLVPFDQDRLQQVFINLVDNAIKFTRPGGLIRISAAIKKTPSTSNNKNGLLNQLTDRAVRNCDEVLEVRVEDNGVGIPENDQRLIFDEFEQSTNQVEGDPLPSSGLGLAIAKKIITAHEGKIWVESTINQGSKFIFQLPLTNNHAINPPVVEQEMVEQQLEKSVVKRNSRTKRRANSN